MRTIGWLGLGVIGAALLGSPAQSAETAASIQYETVGTPQGLSDDFRTTDTADLKFLAITAIDRNRINAAWWQPKGKAIADTTMVVMIHGSGGSYRRAPESALGARLAAKGYAALAIDTRQHDDKINTENFFDVRRDIDAAVHTARALGYRKLVLQGHSLGNIQVQFYAATNWDSDIKAMVLLAPFGNLPWKTRNILVQNEESFLKLIAAAKQSLNDGVLDKPLSVRMSYFTGQDVPVTAQHFFTYRWDKPASPTARSGSNAFRCRSFWCATAPMP